MGHIQKPCQHAHPTLSCHHTSLTIAPCVASYQQPSPEAAYKASTPVSRITANTITATPQTLYADPTTFPGPLALPRDELDYDPKYAPQTLRQWKTYFRNTPITKNRKTIYIIGYPAPRNQAICDHMSGWDVPTPPGSKPDPTPARFPIPSQVAQYLQAFYYGMDVMFLPGWQWSLWDDDQDKKKGKAKPRRHVSAKGEIGLLSPAQTLYQVTYRTSPDGITTQLCLNDIMDALIDSLPSDANSLLMLTKQDLYEDEEDDFCCGRAYGGSRVAIASAFRYHPALDKQNQIDDLHSWPASHCAKFAKRMCDAADDTVDEDDSAPLAALTVPTDGKTPIGAAVEAATPFVISRPSQCSRLFLARFCRTVSHEMGHCLSIDHCVYYACVMQGTATIAEDARQPPYLCPVCLEKVSAGLSPLLEKVSNEENVERKKGADGKRIEEVELQKRWVKERYEAIVKMCGEFEIVGMFAAWKAWAEKRLEQIEEQEKS